MKISVLQYARSLFEATAGKKEAEVKETLHRFAAVLAKNGDLGKGDDIIDRLYGMLLKDRGELEAVLASARKITPATRETVTDYLAGKTGAKKISLREEIDEKLIGGFVLRYQDRILDASLKNGLAEIRQKISG